MYSTTGRATRARRITIPQGLSAASTAARYPSSSRRGTPYAYVVYGGLRIIVTHGDAVMTDEAKDALARHLRADLFISGHIHTTVLEKRGQTVFLNPGSAALSKREDGKNTIAVLEDGVIRILELATGACLAERKL